MWRGARDGSLVRVLRPAVLDLHGLRVADAVRKTTAFVVAEQQRGTAVVRIVNGHGTGALKQAVGDVLRSHPSVAYLCRR